MVQDVQLAKIVEKQMRNWEYARLHARQPAADAAEPAVAPFVTVSRAVGCGGSEVAHRLAERLRWPCFDKEILRHMAGDDQLRKRLYEQMDVHDTSWLESALRILLQGEYHKEDYFRRLSETVLALARQGPGVFIGRGVDFLLPQDRGLRVRFFASHEQRVAAYAELHRCDKDAARSAIAREEHEREELFTKHFGRQKADPTRFDLLINLGRASAEEAIEVILASLRARGMESNT
jgi:cytidylate kinase